jgi:ATP-dependent Clp protease adaptor protein ClpS
MKSNSAVLEAPVGKPESPATDSKPRRQPRFRVILWNDNDHSYDYVIRMMQNLFGHPVERGTQIAVEVDSAGCATCLTTTREHAELKRDQIRAFGQDSMIARCQGSMSATIEAIPQD